MQADAGWRGRRPGRERQPVRAGDDPARVREEAWRSAGGDSRGVKKPAGAGYSSRIANNAHTPAMVSVVLLEASNAVTNSEDKGHIAMISNGNKVIPLAKSRPVCFDISLSGGGRRYIWIGT